MNTKMQVPAISTLCLAVQAALLVMFGLPAGAMAAEEDVEASSLTQPTNTVEVGVEGVSKSSAKFGEYNGLNKSGAYFIGNFSARGGDAYQSYDGGTGVTRWELKGTDLGTDSRELGATVSKQGQWSVGVNFDQLRHHITDSYQTPYQGSMGGNNFSLPNSFGGIDVSSPAGTPTLTAGQQAAYQTQKVYTERKNTSFNAGYLFSPQWSIQFDYNHLDQTGAKLIGASVDSNLGGIGENVVTLLNPTRYKTDTFETALSWVGDKGHLSASYFLSIFKDGYSSVSWDNPFCDGGGAGCQVTPYPVNIYATPPDNKFHQLNLTGGYEFTSATRLAGGLSYARNTQNSSFINDPLMAATEIPRSSLDGLVITTHGDVKLSNQTTRDLALTAGLRYDERDNRTPSNIFGTFNSIAGDTYPSPAVVNTPVSNRKIQFEMAGSYRIDKAQSLRLAYEHEQIKRWCNSATNSYQSFDPGIPAIVNFTTDACVQVPESKENKLSANYKLKAAPGLAFNAGYSYARRRSDINSSYYNPMQANVEGVQNYGFVGYFDATRTEQALKAGVMWQATERLSVGANGRYLDDKYDVTLGVQKGHTWALNLDSTYAYAANGTLSAYVSVQRRQRDLNSSADKSPLAPVAPDSLWSNRLTDDTNTIGITAKQRGLMGGKLELSGDLSYSLGKTTYSTDASNCTNANCGAPADTGTLPTIRSEMWRFKIGGNYQLDKASKIGVAYLHQKLKSEDYYYAAYQAGGMLSGVDPTPAPNNFNILPTNQQAPNYTVNVLMGSYIYSFR